MDAVPETPESTCSACGASEDAAEIVVLTFEQNGLVFGQPTLCRDCVASLRWLWATEEDSVEVELDSDADAPAFGRWERVEGCGLTGIPCVDVRPCPVHTLGLLN